jgi:lipopolysaccharide export system permease protein
VVIAVVFDYSEKAEDFLHGKVTLSQIIFVYYLNFIPYYCSILSPLIVFVSVIFFTAKMASDTEIVAILSSGVSFLRLMYPYFITSVFLALFIFLLNGFIIPPANKIRNEFENKYFNGDEVSNDRNIHFKVDVNDYIYLEYFNKLEKTGYKFTLEKYKNQDLKSKLVASTIHWDSLKRQWKVQDYTQKKIEGLSESMTHGTQLFLKMDLTPKDFEKSGNFKETMNMIELDRFIKRENRRGAGGIETYEFERYKRYALPFATFILTLIGVSLSSKKVRGGVGLHLGIGIGCSFAYIVLIQFSNVFATQGGVPPPIAAWIPNMLFGMVGIYLYQIAPK